MLRFILIYFIWHSFYQSTTILSHVRLPILGHRYPKGIDNPFYTSGCEYLLFVCRGCLRCIVWFSYWFDNLGLITEGNTYRCCATSSLPLRGNTDVASSRIKMSLKDKEELHNKSSGAYKAPCDAHTSSSEKQVFNEELSLMV